MGQVTGPDGKTYQFPDSATQQQIDRYFSKNIKQRGRSILQGVTFGFGDEIEAFVRSSLPGGREYEEIRDDLRDKLTTYKAAYPGEALSMELVGALVPGIATLGGGTLLGAGSAAARTAPTIGRLVGTGALEGAASGIGYSEREGLSSLADAPGGALAGAVFSPLISRGASGFGRFAENFLGSRPATRVQAEVQRLARSIGKTPDEIVADLIDGRLMSENETVNATLRAYKSAMGEPSAAIIERLPARTRETRDIAMQGLQAGLAPNRLERNLIDAMMSTDEQLRAAQSRAYESIFGTVPEVTQDVSRNIESILQRFPSVRNELAGIYSESDRLVPLFAEDASGKISLRRIPNLEDAETVRRILRDENIALQGSSRATRSQNYGDAERQLKSLLDQRYPDLKQVRADFRIRELVKKSFENGRKALTKDPDEIAAIFTRLERDATPAEVQAYKEGVLAAIRFKFRSQPSTIGRFADPDRKEGAILRALFPESQIDDVIKRLETAGAAYGAEQRVIYGSQTAPEQAAASLIGTDTSAQDLLRVAQLDPIAIMQQIGRAVAQQAPKLNENERMRVVDIIMSQDPELVRRALTERDSLGRLYDRISSVLTGLGYGLREFGVQQAAPVGGAMSAGLLGMGQQE